MTSTRTGGVAPLATVGGARRPPESASRSALALAAVVLLAGADGACGDDDAAATATADAAASQGDGGGSPDATYDAPSSADAAPSTARCSGKSPQPADDTWTIDSGGKKRTMIVHLPPTYDATRPTPVVFNFHGYSSNATDEQTLAKMNAKADQESFITVHAQGTVNSWNAGACCGEAANQKIDDVAFVSTMIDTLEERLCVDDRRVFATGMSNGGFLSHRLACELSDRIAAVAPVAGVMGITSCNPGRPISVLHFHGTADGIVPYAGSASLNFPPVPTTFADWAKRDGCTGQPEETFNKGDSRCSTYKTCTGGAEVTLCTVQGGGHTWPGGTPVPALGYTTSDLVATDAMWEFFKRHPR